jgi:hypothetical protein
MNKIKLYHYSNVDFKGYIKPDFFGNNSYTDNSKNLSNVKRSFFYTQLNNKEYFFNGARFLYIADIDKNKIYNITEDKLNLYSLNLSISEFLKKIKNKGYKGFFDNKGLKIVCIFKPIKIKSKRILTKV